MNLTPEPWMTGFQRLVLLGWALFAAAEGEASKPPEYGVYGVQRLAGKPAEVGDPISAASGAFSWSRTLIPLGGPMGLDFSIHYRTDPNAAYAREPGDFPPGYPDFNTFLNAWSWQPAPLLMGNSFLDMTVLLEDGGQVCFQTNAEGELVFATLPEISGGVDKNYQLKKEGDWFYFCDPERGRVTMFEPIPFNANLFRPRMVEDRNGNRLTYTYRYANYDSNPAGIEDNEGRKLYFSYESYTTPSWGVRERLAAVSDHVGRVWTFLYETNAPDNNGRLTFRSVTGPDGATTRFVYAPNGFTYEPGNMASNLPLLAAVVEPEGNATFSNEYAATQLHPETPIHPRCVAQTDAHGNRLTLSMSYTNGNFVGSVTNADGRTNRFVHHNHHDVPPASICDESGNTVALGRNASGHIRSVTDRLGGTTSLGYDATGRRLETITNANGQVLSYLYQTATQTFHNAGAGHDVDFVFEDLARVVHPDGTAEAILRDGRGNATSITDRAEAVWRVEYDAQGRTVSTVGPTGGETRYSYATNGTLTSVTNSDGFSQRYGHDELFRLTSASNADGTSVRVDYDVLGRMTQTVDEAGASHAFEYDANGNLVRAVDALGNAETFWRDAMNNNTSVVDRTGGRVSCEYNSRGRPKTFIQATGVRTQVGYGPDGRATHMAVGALTESREYNAEHLPVGAMDPAGRTFALQRDALGRETNAVDARGGSTRFRRDTDGRVVSKTDPLGRETTFGYDRAGRLAGVTNPGGMSASYDYDAAGRLAQVRDPRSNLWTFGHSANGRLASSTDPLGRSVRYGYDARGRLATATNADGVVATMKYNGASRLTNVTFSGGGTAPLAYAYDAEGRLTEANGVRLEYDAAGRITNAVQAGRTVSARRDAGGRMVSIDYAGGAFQVNYTYDPTNGWLTGASDTLTGHGVRFMYDGAGRVGQMRRTNGVHDEVQYDAAGAVTRIQAWPHLDLRYAHDALGRTTQEVAKVVLAPVPVAAQSAAFQYDAAAQILSPGYGHDARGRLTNAPFGAFAWDAADRLTAAGGATFSYNGLGDVASRTGGGQTTDYMYQYAISTAPLVSELVGGQYRRHYVWTPDGRLLYTIDAANGNAVAYYHFDAAGNALALTDATGGVAAAYAYDPFGRVLAQTGTTDQPFTFAGAHGLRRMESNGLYQAQARWYDARVQRFLSKEPQWPVLEKPELLNPYQYALNNPVAYVDADGFSVLLNSLHNFGMWTQEWKKEPELVARRVAMTTALLQQAAYADLMSKFDGWNYYGDSDVLELAREAHWRHLGANKAMQKAFGKKPLQRGERVRRAFAALPNQDNPALAALVNALDPARDPAQRAEDRKALFAAMGFSQRSADWFDNDIAERRRYSSERTIQTQYEQRESSLDFERAFEKTFEKQIVGAGLSYIVSSDVFHSLFFGDKEY